MRETFASDQIPTGLRTALRSLVRPVAVVTAHSDGQRFAMAATAFCEVSLEPPSMLVCINRSNATYAAIAGGADFGLNILAENQESVSRHCGSGVLADAKFEVGNWLMEAGKPPRLADSCAAMVLRTSQIVDQGTHAVVIAEVIDLSCSPVAPPLAYHDGGYLNPLTDMALKLVAQSPGLGEAGNMTNGFLMMDLMRAFYWFDEGLQSALKARGWPSISRSQSITLANIALGIRRPADIARNLGVTRQAVSKMLKEMEQRGLISIEPDPTDGRASWIGFSEPSRQLRADALDILGKMEATLGQRIGDASLKTLRAAIAKDWGDAPDIPDDPRSTAATELPRAEVDAIPSGVKTVN